MRLRKMSGEIQTDGGQKPGEVLFVHILPLAYYRKMTVSLTFDLLHLLFPRLSSQSETVHLNECVYRRSASFDLPDPSRTSESSSPSITRQAG